MGLIKEVDFTPQEKFVVTFDKFRTYSTKYTVLDTEKNQGKDPLKDEMETKVVNKKVKYNFQVATILAVPNAEKDLVAGDKVLVDFRSCIEIDGYKDIYLVNKYNIVGEMYDNGVWTDVISGEELAGDEAVE